MFEQEIWKDIEGYEGYYKISNLEWATHKEQTNHAYKNNLIKHYKRKINQYDLEGNFIKSYNSIAEAQKINNISRGMICKCCKKIRNKTGGYKWEYVDDNN